MHNALIFLLTLLSACVVKANNCVSIENVRAHHLRCITQAEYTTEELFSRDSAPYSDGLSKKIMQKGSELSEPSAIKKDYTDAIISNPGPFVPSSNHTFYDFSKMQGTRAPQNIGLNFTATTLSKNPRPFFVAPDIQVAVGPTQIIVMTDGGVISYDKATGLKDTIIEGTLPGFSDFFAFQILEAQTLGLLENVDPRLRYDRFTDRWFFVNINLPLAPLPYLNQQILAPNSIFVGFSDSGTITKTTKWTVYSFAHETILPPGDIGLFVNAPSMGIDANAIYVGVNLDLPTLTFIGSSSIFIFPKPALLSGAPTAFAFRDFAGINLPQGVDNFDPAPSNGFLIGNVFDMNLNATLLYLFIIANPSSIPLLAGVVPIVVDPYGGPVSAPHKGNAQVPRGRISTSDDRLRSAHMRNNILYVSQHIGVDQTGDPLAAANRTALRWYEIDISNPFIPIVLQQGTLFDSALVNPRFFYYPSIMTNARGDLSLACTSSAADQGIDAMTIGRLALDPPNTLQSPTFLTATTASYNYQFVPRDGSPNPFSTVTTQRWGDYSCTALDPSDDMTMWTAQEFCAENDIYGVQVAQLIAP